MSAFNMMSMKHRDCNAKHDVNVANVFHADNADATTPSAFGDDT